MEKDLAEGIKRVAQALNKNEVEYMFVGGVAISFYAKPRPSANLPKGVEYDIDVWYQATNDNFIHIKTNNLFYFSVSLHRDAWSSLFPARET